ncbi:glycoside hydrolase family 13 protein [Clostridium sp.]|uniref:glycoside hydrolase family 13 protein n=1 Tax=Clostridium sp. TaxID=1506 RepID=UPI003216737D
MVEYNIYHDSQQITFRSPFGAVTTTTGVTIRIKSPGCENVNLEVSFFDGEKKKMSMTKDESNEDFFYATIETKSTGLIYYYFQVIYKDSIVYYGNNVQGLGGVGQVSDDIPKSYQITVYDKFEIPKWYKEGIMYQIFVDSFYNGSDNGEPLAKKKNSFIYGNWNDTPMYVKDEKGAILRWAFYGGNLIGIIKKLDYLKSLGVTIIYLNPIFQSASTHKYDTGDYLSIDEMFGDEQSFKELCSKAKSLNIRIILDGVFNHTGDDSIYFNKYNNYNSLGAYQSKESDYYKWYKFKEYPHSYHSWWNVGTLPDVNEMDESYREFIIEGDNSVISKWIKQGASGWRLDVADELPDLFIQQIKEKIKKENPDGILIGEVWEDASNKESYGEKRRYVFGNELDSVMNYPFRNVVIDFFREYIDSDMFRRKIQSLYENYPKEFFYGAMNVLGTHDSERILTIYLEHVKNEKKALKLLKLSSLLQMTFPGVPCIYYGDEAGVTGGRDPYNRKSYPWGEENEDLIKWYKLITKLREENHIFRSGEFKFYDISKDVLCYERNLKGKRAIIAINRSDSHIAVDFNVESNKNSNKNDIEYKFKDILLNEDKTIVSQNGVIKYDLKPLEGKIFLEF